MKLCIVTPHETTVTRFVQWLCREMEIAPKSIEVYAQEDLDGALGMCIDVAKDQFMILVKTEHRDVADYFVTIASRDGSREAIPQGESWPLDGQSFLYPIQPTVVGKGGGRKEHPVRRAVCSEFDR